MLLRDTRTFPILIALFLLLVSSTSSWLRPQNIKHDLGSVMTTTNTTIHVHIHLGGSLGATTQYVRCNHSLSMIADLIVQSRCTRDCVPYTRQTQIHWELVSGFIFALDCHQPNVMLEKRIEDPLVVELQLLLHQPSPAGNNLGFW